MSDAAPTRFSGFFTRKKHNERNRSPTHRAPPDGQIPTLETMRSSVETTENLQVMSTSGGDFGIPRAGVENQDLKSFFKIPRRKKATSLSRPDVPTTEHGASAIPGQEQPRLSSQTTRSFFEGILRPNLSTRSSVASVAQAFPTGAMVAASTSLAVQGSPRMEIFSPLNTQALSRQTSRKSAHSIHTTHSTPTCDQSPKKASETSSTLLGRGRSLTYAGRESQRKTSSTGRSSKFFSMGRLRRDADEAFLFRPLSREISPPPSPPKVAPVKIMPSLSLPLRQDMETVHQFLARMEKSMNKTLAASVLATSDDPFHHQCLQLYMQQFNFVDDPLDMALRKFLMDTHLPKETQQIDRVLNAFSERYQICNPRLYDNQITPYVLSFALIMLHTDRFNQNNRNKMTKIQFIKNTRSEYTEHVSTDILEYFYDNIISTPFILVEDEGETALLDRSGPTTPNETMPLRNGSTTALTLSQNTNGSGFGRRSMELYPLIMEDKLSTLRPKIEPILQHDNALSYTGTLPVLNIAKLHAAFTHPATLQLVSARSRPEAFATDHSTQNPLDTDPGLVDIQITKIGILRRKEQKKAGSKPVYREWGVMLTPSQILFFKNIAWVKHYMHQVRDHIGSEPLILDPPVHNYSPDTYMLTSDTVAIYDSSASKKANSLCFLGRGGEQTHLIASSEEELNDWIAKINYAAAFHTIGVRIRGTSELPDQPGSAKNRVQRHASGSTISTLGGGSTASVVQVVAARQNLLREKIAEMEKVLEQKAEHVARLRQQGRNLCTLTPLLPRTRASVISAAGSLSAKVTWARMEHIKTQCHRDILAKDLELETVPGASIYTAPVRPGTPPSTEDSPRTSPSKGKLGHAVHTLMRQVSSETLRLRTNKHSSKGSGSRSRLFDADRFKHHRQSESLSSDVGPELLGDLDYPTESLDHLFKNGPEEVERSEVLYSSPVMSSSTKSTPDSRPGPATLIPLETSSLKAKKEISTRRATSSANDHDALSLISSPSSGQSSGRFILHGRTVSIQSTNLNLQRPSDLLDSANPHDSVNPGASSALALSSSSSSICSSPTGQISTESSEDLFVDAPENLTPIQFTSI